MARTTKAALEHTRYGSSRNTIFFFFLSFLGWFLTFEELVKKEKKS